MFTDTFERIFGKRANEFSSMAIETQKSTSQVLETYENKFRKVLSFDEQKYGLNTIRNSDVKWIQLNDKMKNKKLQDLEPKQEIKIINARINGGGKSYQEVDCVWTTKEDMLVQNSSPEGTTCVYFDKRGRIKEISTDRLSDKARGFLGKKLLNDRRISINSTAITPVYLSLFVRLNTGQEREENLKPELILKNKVLVSGGTVLPGRVPENIAIKLGLSKTDIMTEGDGSEFSDCNPRKLIETVLSDAFSNLSSENRQFL